MNSCMPLASPVIRRRKSARPMRMVTRGLSARPLSISQRPSAMRMAYSWAPSGALISYWTTACWPAALSGLNDSDMPANTWSSTPSTPPSCCWMAATSSSLELRSTAPFSDEKSEASIWLMGRPPCSGRPPAAAAGSPKPTAPDTPSTSRGPGAFCPNSGLAVVDGGVAAELGELVAGVDRAGGARLGAHRQGLGEGAATVEADPAEQLAVGDAGGGEEHVVAPDQVVDGEDLVEVVAGVQGGPALLVVAGPQPAEHRPVQALEGAGGDDALGGAADADGDVHAGVVAGGHDGPGDVAVEQELDPGPGGPDPPDQLLLVAGAVQDADRQLGDVGALGLGDAAQVVLDRGLEVDHGGGVAAHGQLLHVDARARVEHGAPLGQGHHRDRVGQALGGQGGAVDRVDGDVDLGRGAAADPPAVIEHGRVVLLALADHHHPVHGDRAQDRPHGVDRGLVDRLLVAAAEMARPPDGRRLGGPDQLEGEVAVGVGPDAFLSGHGIPPADGACHR